MVIGERDLRPGGHSRMVEEAHELMSPEFAGLLKGVCVRFTSISKTFEFRILFIVPPELMPISSVPCSNLKRGQTRKW